MSLKQLYIQCNSPGELMRWVKPLTTHLHQQAPTVQITILLVPCQYASGEEKRIATEFPGVIKVLTPKESLAFSFTGKAPKDVQPTEIKGIYLGGDPTYLGRLMKRWGSQSLAYTEHNQTIKGYNQVFFKDSDGDLMADSIMTFTPNPEKTRQKYQLKAVDYTLFVPGSRPQHFEYLLPLLVKSIRLIRQENPNFQAIIPISTLISDALYQAIIPKDLPNYIHVIRGDSLELMSLSSTVITIPGTNNSEAMYLGIPMLIFVPLNDPSRLVLDGIAGLIVKIPFFGPLLFRLLFQLYYLNKPYHSAPNIRFKKKLVPELIEKFTEASLAQKIQAFLTDKDEHKKQQTAFKTLHQERPKILEKITQSLLS